MEPAGAAIFAPENRDQLEASFRAFLSRPENRPLVEEQQRLEVAGALTLQEREREARLRAQVLSLPPEDQRRLKPVLQHGVLRRLLQSLTNGGDGGDGGGGGVAAAAPAGAAPPLAAWVDNPRVMGMLLQAARALRRGELSGAELEQLLVAQLRGGGGGGVSTVACDAAGGGAGAASTRSASAAAREWEAGLPNKAVLPSHLLVEALNEHLAERRAGGTAYRAGDFRRALVHYARARAVVEFVRGSTPDDQSEVDRCLGRALWNEAAARMALQEWGAAVAACTRGLAALRAGAAAVDVAGEGSGAGPSGVASAGEAASLDPDLEARLLVRRAKAHLGRHDHRAALADADAAEALEPWDGDIAAVRERARRLAAQEARGGGGDAELAARMLRGLSLGGGGGGGGKR